MDITSAFSRYGEQFKPVLKKVVPKPILQWSKRRITARITKQIGQTEVTPYRRDAFPNGVNLIGPVKSATGLGQSCRLVERVLRETGVNYLLYNLSLDKEKRIDDLQYKDKLKQQLEYSVNLWHINLSEFAQTFAIMGKEAFDDHYNIAFWLWELEDFPDEWTPFINLLDEIWTPSEFVSDSIRKKTNKPVYTIPYYVTAKADTGKFNRAFFKLPQDRFLFLMMYDARSVRERKNPEGAIRAFQEAFSPEQEDVGLVIKANFADAGEMRLLQKQIDGYSNIYLINKNMEKLQVNSLIACSDVFVSLHRAEGFGLVLAEAMLNHVPVIATNWSANTEFMDSSVACMVGYHLEKIEKDIPPYKCGNYWAEPDIEEASFYMKRLREDREYYEQIKENACSYIRTKLGINKTKELMKERLLAAGCSQASEGKL